MMTTATKEIVLTKPITAPKTSSTGAKPSTGLSGETLGPVLKDEQLGPTQLGSVIVDEPGPFTVTEWKTAWALPLCSNEGTTATALWTTLTRRTAFVRAPSRMRSGSDASR
jgi:hypothetical protein